MKMLKYEKLRNARFFAKAFSIINAPAFGWLMTAIVIALASQYFTVQQKCWTDSAPLELRSQLLSREYVDRESFFLNQLKKHKDQMLSLRH